MEFEKEKVIEKLEQAKEYGLSYSKIAKEINIQPITLYMFKNGTNQMSKKKQLEALCVVENYMEQVRNQLRQIEHKGLCIK